MSSPRQRAHLKRASRGSNSRGSSDKPRRLHASLDSGTSLLGSEVARAVGQHRSAGDNQPNSRPPLQRQGHWMVGSASAQRVEKDRERILLHRRTAVDCPAFGRARSIPTADLAWSKVLKRWPLVLGQSSEALPGTLGSADELACLRLADRIDEALRHSDDNGRATNTKRP